MTVTKFRKADCHPEKKHQARGLCKSCYDKWLKKQNPDYAKRQKENTLKWIDKNKEQHLANISRSQKQAQASGRRSLRERARNLRSFDLTLEDQDRIIQEQGGGCGICGGPPGRRWYDIDHCHITGIVRGFLCGKCNKGLGLLGDNAEGLTKALEYLQKAEND